MGPRILFTFFTKHIFKFFPDFLIEIFNMIPSRLDFINQLCNTSLPCLQSFSFLRTDVPVNYPEFVELLFGGTSEP